MRRHAGFTLVEVLVALLVLALMAGMAWQGVDGIARARSASQGVIDQTLRINAVIGQWESDLARVQDTGAVPALNFDGATLRRTPDGGYCVCYPARRGSRDGDPALVRPLDDEAREAIEVQILADLRRQGVVAA